MRNSSCSNFVLYLLFVFNSLPNLASISFISTKKLTLFSHAQFPLSLSLFVVVTLTLSREESKVEDHGALEAGQLLTVKTTDCKVKKSRLRTSGPESVAELSRMR